MYARISNRAAALTQQGRESGIGSVSNQAVFEVVLDEMCMAGECDVGEAVRCILEEAKEDHQRESACRLLKLMLDPAAQPLFQTGPVGSTDLLQLLLPPSASVCDALSSLAASLELRDRVRFFDPVFSTIAESLEQKGSGSYPQELQLLEKLLTPPIAEALVSHNRWACGGSGAVMSERSFLGPFFAHRTTSLEQAFPTKGSGGVVVGRSGYAEDQYQYAKRLAAMLKSSFLAKKPEDFPGLRSGVLTYFEAMLASNGEARKTMGKRSQCASQTALLTLLAVLIELTEPVYHKQSSVAKIDPAYLSSPGCRLNVAGEARVTGWKPSSDSAGDGDAASHPWYAEVFFLAVHALDLCLVSSVKHCEELQHREVPSLMSVLERMKAIGHPHSRSAEAKLHGMLRMIAELRLHQEKVSGFAIAVVKFTEFLASWLLLAAHGDASGTAGRELRESPADSWKQVPEYFVLSACSAVEWFHRPLTLPLPALLTLFSHLMSSQLFLNNPYSRAAQVPALHHLLVPPKNSTPTTTPTRYTADAAAMPCLADFLMQSVMCVYVDLEALDQFFEKYTYRYHLGSVLRELFKNASFKKVLLECSRQADVVFVKFFNMVVNDANWLLSEGLKKVKRLGDMYAAPPRLLEGAVHECRQYMTLANEAVCVVHTLVPASPDPFLHPALAGKVAGILDFFLTELCTGHDELRQDIAAKCSFDRKKLVGQVVDCFLALASCEKSDVFRRSIIDDERCYSPQKFTSALESLAVLCGGFDPRVAQLSQLFEKLQAEHGERDAGMDVDLPDDLCDPILSCPLEDPLKLPESGEWCERRSIVQHLLNNSTNPFNRAPLSIDQLEEYNNNPEVKKEAQSIQQRVKDFLAQNKKKG